MKTFYTYLHCKPNGEPFYVGKGTGTSNKARRCFEFKKDRNTYYKNIVKKYGKENILVYVFLCVSEDQAYCDEIHQIAMLRKEGYKLCNLTDGGDGVRGLVVTEETKKRISKAHLGKKMSKETKAKISEAHKGKIISVETRKKLSESVKLFWLNKRCAYIA